MTACISKNLLADFVSGRVPTEHCNDIARHLAACTDCQDATLALTEDARVREFRHAYSLRRAELNLSDAIPGFRKSLYSIATNDSKNTKLMRSLNRVSEETYPTDLGRFRLLKRLGAGGIGVVYLAEDRKLQRQVALKLPRSEIGRASCRERV